MRRAIAVLLAAAVLPGLAGTAAAAEAPVATFEFHAEAGAFPVDGWSADWSTPEQEVRVREQAAEDGALVIDGESENGWEYVRIILAGPGNAPLEVGSYTDVRSRPTEAHPGLLVISDGLGCAPVYGGFTVNSLGRDATGRLTDVDVDVEQRCGAPDAPAFTAHVTLSS